MKKITILLLIAAIWGSNAMDRDNTLPLTGYKRVRDLSDQPVDVRFSYARRLADARLLLSISDVAGETSEESSSSASHDVESDDQDNSVDQIDRVSAGQPSSVEVVERQELPPSSSVENPSAVQPVSGITPEQAYYAECRAHFLASVRLHGLVHSSSPCSVQDQREVSPVSSQAESPVQIAPIGSPGVYAAEVISVSSPVIRPLVVRYTCFVCREKFASAIDLQNHLKFCHGKTRYICMCGSVYARRGFFMEHAKTCFINWQDVKPVSKNIKGRRFCSDQPSMESICPVCEKAFASPIALVGHFMGTHFRKRFACKCGKEHKLLKELNEHRKGCRQLRDYINRPMNGFLVTTL